MYGLIGRFYAASGQRDALIEAIQAGINEMPGCLSYVIATDSQDENAVWITEVWDNAESHRASLKLPEVQQAIVRAKPLIASFGEHFETRPVGGMGLRVAGKDD
jgi:quinol monooxygenase YgiN